MTAPGLGDYISGVILYDETIRQRDRHGTLLVERLLDAGIIAGIKVDLGAKNLALHAGETVTEGLDGLRTRLAAYAGMGARFAKWRAVIGLGNGQPSHACRGRGRRGGDSAMPAPKRAGRGRRGCLSSELASARLNAMNSGVASGGGVPWPLVFSFARAIQQPALGIWRGEADNVAAAQHALLHRARCNHAALCGAYDAAMEHEPALRLAS